jgi:hypothetical protein
MSRPRKAVKILSLSETKEVTRKKLIDKLSFFKESYDFVDKLPTKSPDQLSWMMWASARINTLELELC